MTLEARLKAKAMELGFALAGITHAQPPSSLDHFRSWLARGMAGEMRYLDKGAEARADLQRILPGVQSILMLAMNYHHPTTAEQKVDAKPTGRIARYAQSVDYHHVLWGKLDQLLAWLQREVPACQGRGIVDTAPVLERDLAHRAGLGWFGKNTMLIHPQLGSFFFLAALLVDLRLEPDPPFATEHCGSCTACLDACPTQAFPEPGVLDARRCISYLTIELRGPIPTELRTPMGDWLFGCDVCQEVCPWNHKSIHGRDPDLAPLDELQTPDLEAWLTMPPEALRTRLRSTPLLRPKRAGLLRNLCIVLGNRGDRRAVPLLETALQDPEPLVRGAAAWALGKFSTPTCSAILERALASERDATVLQEIAMAMAPKTA